MLKVANKRVTFLRPPWLIHKSVEDTSYRVPPSLGLGYVAAIAEKMGWTVQVIDAYAEGWNQITDMGNGFYRVGVPYPEIEKKIASFEPDFVGVHCMFTTQSLMMQHATAMLKKAFESTVVVGGAHPSAIPDQIASNPNIDYVFVGESENALKRFLNDESPETIPGMYFRGENGQMVNTGGPERVADLDTIPFPAYHHLPMDKYFEASAGGRGSRRRSGHREMSLITSRGCPYKCTFCSIYQIMGRTWRYRSPQNVIQEIRFLTKTYGIQHINFEDDMINADMKRFEALCDDMVTADMGITWDTPNGVRADHLNETLLRKMKASGCNMVKVGIESGDQAFLDKIINKDLDLNKVVQAVKDARKIGLHIEGFFIIGIPGETPEIVERTIKLACQLAAAGLHPGFSIASPLPNTPLYKLATKKGYLLREPGWAELTFARQQPIIQTPWLTPEQCLQYYAKARRSLFVTWLKTNPLKLLSTAPGRYALSDIRLLPRAVKEATRWLFPQEVKYSWTQPEAPRPEPVMPA